MTNEENTTQLIDDYLAGNLSPEMMSEVMRRLKEDTDFDQQVKAQQLIKTFFDRKWEKDTREQLAGFRTRLNAETAISEKGAFAWFGRCAKIFAVAASFALLMVAAWLLTRRSVTPSGEAITYTIPIQEEGPNSLGFGTSGAFVDSLVVAIVPAKDNSLLYQFQDTLKLFLQPTRNQYIKVSYNRSTDRYTMLLNDTVYILERGYANVQPLQRAD